MGDQKKSTKRRNPDHQAESTPCRHRKLKRVHRQNPSLARKLAMEWALITWYDNHARHWRTLFREQPTEAA